MTKSKFQSLHLFLLISGLALSAKTSNLIEDGHNPNQHIEVLDPEGKYKLQWFVDWDVEGIFFNVTVETRGFIQFGLSKDGISNPEREVDLIIGGVDTKGEPYFSDRYSVGNGSWVVDEKQDWDLLTASESGGFTFLSFFRRFDTGDFQDIPIDDNTLIVVWGYGLTDDVVHIPANNPRGNIPMHLRDPDLTPLVIQGGRNMDYKEQIEGSDVKVWSIAANFQIPPKRTTYWCQIHKLTLEKKHHIIGATFQFNNETKQNVHHMFLYHCVVPNPGPIYEPLVNYPGEECYSQAEPELKIQFRHCVRFKVGYAIGAASVFFPATMGIPIGETGASEYYLSQTHYDNPTGRSDLRSELTINTFYTDKLRPHDGGTIHIGHHVPGTPSLLLPPGLTNHRIHGDCTSECTRKMLPPQGIKITVATLHAHNAGRGMSAHILKKDKEISPIIEDTNWKFDFQQARLLREEVTILPGDEIRTTCHYHTTSINRTTVGGYGTDQEMCVMFAVYYTLLEEYTLCVSELISPVYAATYLGGLRNVTWDRSKLEFVATEPKYLDGLTMSQISDSPYVNWSEEQITQLQFHHELFPQVSICLNSSEMECYVKEGMPNPLYQKLTCE